MPTILKTKNSVITTVVPTTLQQGELAVNITDKKMWVGNAATTPVQLLGDGGSGSFTSIAFGAGTVSAPSITFTGDTNTGIYSPAADTIAFTEGGVESMRVDSIGNLGLGTASPLSIGTNYTTLDIRGSAGGGLRFGVAASANHFQMYTDATNVQMYTAAAIPILFSTNGTERMRIDSAGNVGIGITSLSNTRLYVNSAANDARIIIGFNNTSVNYLDANTNIFRTGGSSEVMRIDSIGRVGIGTSSPAVPLDISATTGVMRITSSTGTNTAYLYTTNTGGDFYIGTDSSTGGSFTGTAYARFLYGTGAYPMAFYTNSTERMRILSTGEVVVGKTNNDNSTPGIGLSLQSATAPLLKMVKTVSGGINSLVNWHSGTYVGGIDFNNTSTSFPTSSDIRLKKNIVNAGSATEKIDQIRIVSHGWKHDADEIVEFGIIAQELYAVAPQAVTKGDDGEEIEKTWGVDYSKLVPLLLKAHQEQQAIINNLTTRLNALEGK